MIETSLQHEPVALPERSLGRTARSVAGYGLLTGLMFVTQLFVFIPAALFQCAVRNGRRAAWLALAFAAALAALYTVQAARLPGTTPDDVRILYCGIVGLILGIALPALAALPLVERGEPFGRVLMLAVVTSAAGLLITETGFRALAGFSPHAVQLAHMRTYYEQQSVPSAYIEAMRKSFDLVATILPAVTLTFVIIAFVLSLVMFSRLDYRSGNERGRVYLFRNLSLPDWLLFAFILGGATPLLSGLAQKVTANVLAVVVFLYFLQGLAIFRSMLASLGVSFLGTMVGFLIIGILTLTSVALLPLSIAGLFDSFFDFRHFRRKDDSHEGHSD